MRKGRRWLSNALISIATRRLVPYGAFQRRAPLTALSATPRLPQGYPEARAPMKTLLTDQAIRRFKPPAGGRVEITDTHPDVTGFTLRLSAGGARSFNMVYRSPTDGKQARIALGTYPATTLAEAREKAKRYRGMIEAGTDPRHHEREEAERRQRDEAERKREQVERMANQFDQAAADFLEGCRVAGLRSVDAYAARLRNHILPIWSGRHINDIDAGACRTLLRTVERKAGSFAANRTLATVSSLFSWLRREGRFAGANPAAGVKSNVREKARDRVLSDAELAAVWQATDGLSPVLRAFVRLLILTGQRRTEVASMRWGDLDQEAALWTLPRERSKTDRAHNVPLVPAALDVITSAPRLSQVYVFSSDGRTFVRGYSKLKAQLDTILNERALTARAVSIAPWRLHDLRRTVATGMARLGQPLHVIEKVLAHESGSFGGIVGVYQRFGFDREKRQALEAWANHVTALTDTSGKVTPLRRGA